ncbi:MAG: hypothetical protein KVP17_001868 [Porospora cf. gigantea B]|uniref:uncharacterized protein n=1 Tax=Porospora cf. gigantea B TaxID=2853592 RepID=UPI0035719278|nr:MAG: hypothetical protein KVP17_001868 [Porospora cf. gigantea B]
MLPEDVALGNPTLTALDAGASPEEVMALREATATLVLVGVPGGCSYGSSGEKSTSGGQLSVGIDHVSWAVGKDFLGVNFLSPGAHYLYWSWGPEGGRSGRFIWCSAGAVLAFKWNDSWESLDEVGEEELLRWEETVTNLRVEPHLAPYQRKYHTVWIELTAFVNEAVISRLSPVGRRIRSSLAEYDKLGTFDQGVLHPSTIFFSELPKPKPSTAAYLDQSDVTERLLAAVKKSDLEWSRKFHTLPPGVHPIGLSAEEIGLLGELQFAFVVFLLGQTLEGFEQWKALLLLLSSSPGLAESRPRLVSDFIRVVCGQMQSMPRDLFEDTFLKDSFLKAVLGNIGASWLEAEDATVRSRAIMLQAYFRKAYQIDISTLEDEGDDAPVLLDEEPQFVAFA